MSKFKIGDLVFLPQVDEDNVSGMSILQFKVTLIEHNLILKYGELKIANFYIYTYGESNYFAEEDSLFGSFEEAVKYFGSDVFKSFQKFELEQLI